MKTVARRVFTGFGLAVAILLVLVVAAQRSIVAYQRTSQQVAHTQDVIGSLETLLFLMKETESSHRGYAIIGDTSFLVTYRAAAAQVPSQIARIRRQIADDPVQHRRLDSLELHIKNNLQFRARTIATQQAGGIAAARQIVSTRTGKFQGDSIRALIDGIEGEERSLLGARSAQASATGRLTIWLLAIGAMLSLAIVLIATVTVRRALQHRIDAERAVQESETRLMLALDAARMGAWDLDLVTDRAVRSLRHDQIFGNESMLTEWGGEIFMTHVFAEDREHVRERFATAFANGTLDFECRIVWPDQTIHWIAAEGRVYRNEGGDPVRMLGTVADITDRKTADAVIASHAAELEAVNAELEAFSYSVSHDLRAPLRHIDGFSDLLRRHLGTQLDDRGRGYLQTISGAAKQMGRLIDDLLVFSRMGRTEMHMTPVELGQVVSGAITDLKPDTDGRTIDWNVGFLPVVLGDPSMLRQVMANLIGNAVKYTSRRQRARIEIGCDTPPGRDVTVFVRDNGAGFDSRYSHKLFGVFQRLHSTADFEGTGIGLAIVRRIVARHGGRAWAEGAVDAGATFFVSLPRPHGAVTHG